MRISSSCRKRLRAENLTASAYKDQKIRNEEEEEAAARDLKAPHNATCRPLPEPATLPLRTVFDSVLLQVFFQFISLLNYFRSFGHLLNRVKWTRNNPGRFSHPPDTVRPPRWTRKALASSYDGPSGLIIGGFGRFGGRPERLLRRRWRGTSLDATEPAAAIGGTTQTPRHDY